MHDDITSAIAAAWERVRPRLERDPDELQRRLARRNGKLINSPPRAWCLAVRAADLRIEDVCAIFDISSRRRRELGLDDSACGDAAHPPQRVMLDSDALRRLCTPVRIPSPGLPAADVARLLGVS